jgi:glycosyltransferase involved in cell wall biosynthesis
MAKAITVVVPAFRARLTVGSAVASALAQDGVDVEVVVVDDGSDDGTGDVVDALASDPRVVATHRRNGGPVAARNDGLRRAAGEFVLFLDADDELAPGALVRLCELIDDSAVAASGRFRAVDDDGHDLDIGTWATEQLHPVVRRGGAFIPSPGGLTPEAILTRLVTPPPGGTLIRRDAAFAIGGYDPRARRSEDLDFLVRLATVGRIAMVEETVLVYRRRATQRSASTRHRRFGRQVTMVGLIVRAPSRAAARERCRGVVAHHVDRAQVRWRYSHRSPRDLIAVARSLGLAAAFGALGPLLGGRGPASW